MKPPPMPSTRAEEGDRRAERDDRQHRDVELGAAEADLQRQAVDPATGGGAAHRRERFATFAGGPGSQHGAHELVHHQPADRPEEDRVADGDDEGELAEAAQHGEELRPAQRAQRTGRDEQEGELEVHLTAPPIGEGAGGGAGDDLWCHGGDRDGGRNPREDEERRHQEAAADAEEARDEADRRAHRQHEQNADRHLRNRQIKCHERQPSRVRC